MTTTNENNLPVCAICGHSGHYIGNHIQEAHGMSLEEYSATYPNAPLASQAVVDKMNSRRKRRAVPTAVDELVIKFHDFEMKPNLDVDVSVCGANGKGPEHYRLPSYGDAKEIIFDVLIGVETGASQLIYGPAGTGKDAFWLNFSMVTRTPCISIQINPDIDISKVLFSHEISANDGTYQKVGHLAKCLTEGYKTESGKVIPYLVILTDIDRCDPAQGEHLRLMLDSVSQRIQHPDGHTLPVLEGTRFVATANSIGNGSERYSSAQVMDASILSRFNNKVEFCQLDWRDEEMIIRNKFPLLARICGGMTYGEKSFFANIGDIVKVIRKAIKQGNLSMEFGHREVSGWMKQLQGIVSYYTTRGKDVPADLMKRGFRQVCGAVEGTQRDQLTMLVDTFIQGGLIDQGDTSHIGEGELVDL